MQQRSPRLQHRPTATHFGAGYGNGRLVQDAAHTGRRREDVRAGFGAQQSGANRQTLAARDLEHIEHDVGRIQIGANQQIGTAFQLIARQSGVAQLGIQRTVALQFAFAGDMRRNLAEDFVRPPHFERAGAFAAAKVRVRQKGHARRDAKALHLEGGHARNVCQLFGAGVFIDVGVGDEERVLFQQHGAECGEVGRALLQDPQWLVKLREGRDAEILPFAKAALAELT